MLEENPLAGAHTYETVTDDNGHFSIRKTIDPLFPPDLGALTDRAVELRAKLIEPAGIVVHATLDIDAADGTPSNQEKKFQATSNHEISLGTWSISMGQNILVVYGRTRPSVPNATLKVEVRVL